MNHYDPEHAPNAEEWLSLEESMRIALAETIRTDSKHYHRHS